jgi:hypothetical protein
LTILIILIATYTCNLIGSRWTFAFFLIVFFSAVIIQSVDATKFKKRISKSLLMLSSTSSFNNPYGILILNLFNIINPLINIFSGNESAKIYTHNFIVVPFMTIVTVLFLCSLSITNRIKEKAILQYPEAFAS